jgi:hypothetical protein
MDVKRKWSHLPGHKAKKHYGWVVTNTRFTKDALQYGKCIGLSLLSWDYPHDNGLKDLIGRVNLHPVTCLSSVNEDEKKELLDNDIVFCKQLSADDKILQGIAIDERKKDEVRREAKAISNFNT